MKSKSLIFIIFVFITLLTAQLTVAEKQASFSLIGKWDIITLDQDYICRFTFETTDVYIVDNVNRLTQKFNWKYDTKTQILMIDRATYNVDIIDDNHFSLTPFDAPEWMEGMIFIFKRVEGE